MKTLTLFLALTLVTGTAFAQSKASGSALVYKLLGGSTNVSISGKAAEAMYNTMSDVRANKLGQKVGLNFTCIKFKDKKTKKVKFSCDLSIEDTQGAIGHGAAG